MKGAFLNDFVLQYSLQSTICSHSSLVCYKVKSFMMTMRGIIKGEEFWVLVLHVLMGPVINIFLHLT